jgi:hypothetical protein
MRMQIRLFTLMQILIWIQILASILACHLQIDADPDQVPYPAYHFDVNPDADPDPDFNLMQIRMGIWIFV